MSSSVSLPSPASTPRTAAGSPVRAPLVAVAVALASGMVVDRYLLGESLTPAWHVPLWWGFTGSLLLGWWVLQRVRRESSAAVLLLVAVACVGGVWHHWCWNYFSPDEIGRFATTESYPCAVEGIALASPERMAAPDATPFRAIPTGERSRFVLRVTQLRNGTSWEPASGECEVTIDGHLLGVSRGDRVQLFGRVQRPRPLANPGGFDYATHLRGDRHLCAIRSNTPTAVRVIEKGAGWNLLRAIDHVRTTSEARLWRSLGPERAPLACAILLGASNAVPREQTQSFMVTGATHVLVVSGLHAGILVGGVLLLLHTGVLPRRWALGVAMVTIVIYTLVTGTNPPVVRAAVLAELVCLGLWMGVSPLGVNSLAAAAIVVMGMNPPDLFRTGTQLSFLCTATLVWFSSVWAQRQRNRSPLDQLLIDSRAWYAQPFYHFRDQVATTSLASLAIWVVALPLVMYQFHLVTPIAPATSWLLLPLVGVVLMSGFAFLMVGWLVPPLEAPLAWVCEVTIGWMEGLVALASRLEQGHWWTPGPPLWWVLGWFLLLAVTLRMEGTRWGWKGTIMGIGAWVLVGCVPVATQRLGTPNLEVAFLDVGHGTSVVVTTPEGTTFLYDAGSLGSPSGATDTISRYLWSRGITSIDGILLSHADVDHFNAVPGLLQRFHVGRVFVSPHMFSRSRDPLDRSAPEELRRELESHGVPIETVMLGDRLRLDASTTAEVLYPDWLGNFGSDNAHSIVLGIECRGVKILLPGDLESPGMEGVMADEPYDCDILLAPHHGSRRSDPPGFAQWSTPEYVVVSGSPAFAGEGTAATYRAAGAQVFTTGKDGAALFTVSKQGVVARSFAEPRPSASATAQSK